MAVIPYADVLDRQLLPIDAQDIVTKVRLVIAGNKAGEAPDHLSVRTGVPLSWVTREYAAEPIVFEYEAPEHATYAAERSFALPPGLDPFLPPQHSLIGEPGIMNFTNPGSPSAMRDGDPLTFAERADLGEGPSGDNGGWVLVAYSDDPALPEPRPRIWGYRLVYRQTVGATSIRFQNRVFLQPEAGPQHLLWAVRNVALIASGDDIGSEYLVLPGDAGFAQVNNADPLGRASGYVELITSEDADLRLIAFYPLVLNEPLLLGIARAQVRLPAQSPTRVTVRGVIPPDRTHTITGWPGGDYTGVVAQHQYELGRTIIDFEQAGAPAGLPAEAMEAARERQTAIRSEIAVAGYSLKMGERQ